MKPGKSGATNLLGRGNAFGGDDEGVDGLDILENLSFTNFAPSVACLLGDEFADGKFRNFTRLGMDLNVGQGVFGLDAGFTIVPGIRLQQFNRLPHHDRRWRDVYRDSESPSPATTLPTGNVTFLTNDAVLGVVSLSSGIAALGTRFLPPGVNAVAAAYAGDENYFGSTNALQQSVAAVCSDMNFILSIVMDPTNTLTSTFVGSTNAQYRLLQTADPTLPITNWTVMTGSTNVAFDGTWQYTVTNDSDAAFFRVEALAPCP